MEVLIRENADTVSRLTARLIADRLCSNPRMVLGCATGRTMESIYESLIGLYRKEGFSFQHCQTFNLDEYVGLDPEDPRSYRAYMVNHFFNHIDILEENTHLPNGSARDLRAEAEAYEQLLVKTGGIDLQLLGLGETGHIGFNEPLSSLMSRTREKTLSPVTRMQNAPMFDHDLDAVPTRALTMGVGTILEAKEVIFIVTGKKNAEILAKAAEGPITAMISATALQLHPNCKIIVDEDAAEHLQGQDYYRWVFENEPEWQPYRGI